MFLQVIMLITCHMTSHVTVIRKNTLKRFTKDHKNHADYSMFHSHLSFSNISKKAYADN